MTNNLRFNYFKKLTDNSSFAFIWTISVLFYILRSVFEPGKYVFYISIILLIVNVLSNIKLYISKNALKKLEILSLYIILGVFLIIGIFNSTSFEIQPFKDLSNFLIILLFAFVFLFHIKDIRFDLFFKLWIYSTFIIVILGLFKWIFGIVSINFIPNKYLVVPTPSFVSDINFFGNHLIISLLLFFLSLKKNWIKWSLLVNQIFIFLILGNIILSTSRRSIIILSVLLLLFTIYYLFNNKAIKDSLNKNLGVFLKIIYSLLLVLILCIPFRTKIIVSNKTRAIISSQIFRYATIVVPNIDNNALYSKLWHSDNKNSNLINNGNFENGLTYWTYSAPDTITHEIIKTKYGNAVRVSRSNGHDYWPLLYSGRQVYYRKSNTYQFSFKFRIVRGNGVPFKIGWWMKDNGKYVYNLEKDISPLGENWYECKCLYQFKEDHQDKVGTFMNSLQPNATVDFADIRLECLDCQHESIKYVDQLTLKNKTDTLNKFTSPRTERWKYTFEIFKEFNFVQKLFGTGFDYGGLFNQKFLKNKKQFDYPHNPILSTLLYSGILGFLYYIFFLAMSLIYYIKNFRSIKFFLSIYLITFFYMMFSANTHFSVPIFAILSIIPFIADFKRKNVYNGK